MVFLLLYKNSFSPDKSAHTESGFRLGYMSGINFLKIFVFWLYYFSKYLSSFFVCVSAVSPRPVSPVSLTAPVASFPSFAGSVPQGFGTFYRLRILKNIL
jgi:hypothetical protein